MHGILPNLRAINKLMQNQEATMSKVPQPKSSACHPAPVRVSRPCLLVQLLLPREADQNQTRVLSCSLPPVSKYIILSKMAATLLIMVFHTQKVCVSAKWQISTCVTFRPRWRKNLVDWLESANENQWHFSGWVQVLKYPDSKRKGNNIKNLWGKEYCNQ